MNTAGRSVCPKLSDSTACRKSVFVVRPTNRTSVAQGFFRWVQVLGRSPDTPGGSKNALGPVGILLKRSTSGASFPESMLDVLDRLPTEPGHTLPNPCTEQQISPRVNRVSIYEGGKVHYRVDKST